ncbi:MAG: DUF1292 domain-containing protein [Saccharofermentanales bacterium]
MKTTNAIKKKHNETAYAPQSEKQSGLAEEEVAVIVDVQSGAEYYMFQIDFFKIDKKAYTVMVPYEPDHTRQKEAEVVILRSQISKNGDQLYIAIRDKKELEMAFDVFFKRFEESEGKEEQ